ncbi:hypothetical protein KIPB_012442 [Kipferlia bialata]|uniref:Uncharacterized protein n=1 Tax=Kipferlia bialata TaxID=797122 RepID=A0A9K3GN10_9EUKA|nr:hypothetical protein KIPB_012442 [Kipferlia bialata]|eukprot:g12442.t1
MVGVDDTVAQDMTVEMSARVMWIDLFASVSITADYDTVSNAVSCLGEVEEGAVTLCAATAAKVSVPTADTLADSDIVIDLSFGSVTVEDIECESVEIDMGQGYASLTDASVSFNCLPFPPPSPLSLYRY